jgi:hypothetical protein
MFGLAHATSRKSRLSWSEEDFTAEAQTLSPGIRPRVVCNGVGFCPGQLCHSPLPPWVLENCKQHGSFAPRRLLRFPATMSPQLRTVYSGEPPVTTVTTGCDCPFKDCALHIAVSG